MDTLAESQSFKTADNILAVVCVVESSLTLASEWLRVLVEYVSPMLKRLHDAFTGHQVCILFYRPLVLSFLTRYIAPSRICWLCNF